MSEFDRRKFVAGLGATLGGLLGSSSYGEGLPAAQGAGAARPGSRPNVIVLICDDLGFGDLGCYGSTLNTPNLDRFANEGVRFTRYNTPHALCSAARGALLTGRYSTRTGCKPVYFPQSTDGLNLDEMTIANVLHAGNYESMCIGKWHLGSKPDYLPTKRGFDSFFGVPYSVDMRPFPLMKDETVLEENTDRAMLTPRYTEAAVKFIDSSHERPFFLYLAYSYPHIPIDASPRFKGKSKRGIYGDAIEEIDWSVGEILKTLRRKGLDENTLILFTGDHGPWYQGSVEQLRGRKGTTYEGGCRVPFLARWKGVIPAGRVVDGWASHMDVLPTVASLCGAALPAKPVDGVDIFGLMTERESSIEHPAMLYFSALRNYHDLQGVRHGKWKLRIAQYVKSTYVLAGNPGENLLLSSPELYDLENDPGENYDIARDHPDIVKQLQEKIDQAIPTFPPAVVQSYQELKKRVDSPTTPEAAQARPATYAPGPYHYDGDPN